jgi:putative transposase
MIQRDINIGISRQCELLGIHRSGLYYAPVAESEQNLNLLRLLDEQYLITPFYGKLRLTKWLGKKGFQVNHKRVKRLMRIIGWQTIYRKPNTSWKNSEHKVYPYLLKDLKIDHANQVWGIDITYVPMRRGFMYLCAIIDLHTRFVVNWSISNTMTAQWCCQLVEEAIMLNGKPEIVNTDQGSQFTSLEFIELLKEHEILISMDGKGRAIDNIFIERLWKSVKYECIYLHAFEDGVQLYEGLDKYFTFYNTERLHQSLNYETPESFYKKVA